MKKITTGGTPPSDIPEKLELEVMNFIREHVVYAVKENVYVIESMNDFASALIRKYKITL